MYNKMVRDEKSGMKTASIKKKERRGKKEVKKKYDEDLKMLKRRNQTKRLNA